MARTLLHLSPGLALPGLPPSRFAPTFWWSTSPNSFLRKSAFQANFLTHGHLETFFFKITVDIQRYVSFRCSAQRLEKVYSTLAVDCFAIFFLGW